MSVSLEELLKALEEAPSNKRKKRVAGEHRQPAHVFRFAEEMGIEEGDGRIPNYMLFYYYRYKWTGLRQDEKLKYVTFFRVFRKKFNKIARTGKQRYYRLNPKAFDMSREGKLEAKHHVKEFKRRSKGQNIKKKKGKVSEFEKINANQE